MMLCTSCNRLIQDGAMTDLLTGSVTYKLTHHTISRTNCLTPPIPVPVDPHLPISDHWPTINHREYFMWKWSLCEQQDVLWLPDGSFIYWRMEQADKMSLSTAKTRSTRDLPLPSTPWLMSCDSSRRDRGGWWWQGEGRIMPT